MISIVKQNLLRIIVMIEFKKDIIIVIIIKMKNVIFEKIHIKIKIYILYI